MFFLCTLLLYSDDLSFIVLDAESGVPVHGAELVISNQQADLVVFLAGPDGMLRFNRSDTGLQNESATQTELIVQAAGYLPVVLDLAFFEGPEHLEINLIPYEAAGIELLVEAARTQRPGVQSLHDNDFASFPGAGNPLAVLNTLPEIQNFDQFSPIDASGFMNAGKVSPGSLSMAKGVFFGIGSGGQHISNGMDPAWNRFRWRSIPLSRYMHLIGIPSAASIIPDGIGIRIDAHTAGSSHVFGQSPGGVFVIQPVFESNRRNLLVGLQEISYSQNHLFADGTRIAAGFRKSIGEFTWFPIYNMTAESVEAYDGRIHSASLVPGNGSIVLALESNRWYFDSVAFYDYASIKNTYTDPATDLSTGEEGISVDGFLGLGTGISLIQRERMHLLLKLSGFWRQLTHQEFLHAEESQKHNFGSYSGNNLGMESLLLLELQANEHIQYKAGFRYEFQHDIREIANRPYMVTRNTDEWHFALPDLIPNLPYPNRFNSPDPALFIESAYSRGQTAQYLISFVGSKIQLFRDSEIDGEIGWTVDPVRQLFRPSTSVAYSGFADRWQIQAQLSSTPMMETAEQKNLSAIEQDILDYAKQAQSVSARSYTTASAVQYVQENLDVHFRLTFAYYAGLSAPSPLTSLLFSEYTASETGAIRISDALSVYEPGAGRFGSMSLSAGHQQAAFSVRAGYTLSRTEYELSKLGWTRANSDVRHQLSLQFGMKQTSGLQAGVHAGLAFGRPFTPREVVRLISEEDQAAREEERGVPMDPADIYGFKILDYNSATYYHPHYTLDFSLTWRFSGKTRSTELFLETINLASIFNADFAGELSYPAMYKEGATSLDTGNRRYEYGEKVGLLGTALGLRIRF